MTSASRRTAASENRAVDCDSGGRGESPMLMVSVPVRCPRCRTETLAEFPELVVVTALTRWNNMNLYAPGHAGCWSATAGELNAMRRFLGTAWLAARSAAQRPEVAGVGAGRARSAASSRIDSRC